MEFLWQVTNNWGYMPSGQNSLFQKASQLKEGGATGGFKENLGVMHRYATFVISADQIQISELLGCYDEKINPNPALIQGLVEVLKDRSVFMAMSDFLRNDGKIDAWPSGGFYEREAKTLHIGLGCGDGELCDSRLKPYKTIVHELLHYIFDKSDSVLAEAQDGGGADHQAIYPIEERFEIIFLIKNGLSPINEEISGLYGFTAGGKLGKDLEKLIQKGDLKELKRFVSSEVFYTNYVHSGMTSLLSGIGWAKKNPQERYLYPEAQIQDLAYLWAYNAAIIQQALRLAFDLNSGSSTFSEAVFSSNDYQSRFDIFLTRFIQQTENSPSLPLRKTAKAIMDELLED